jgi:hypothetical protein
MFNATGAFPLTGLAVNPDLVGILLNTTLTLNGSPTSVDQQNAIADATTAAQNYINNLLIGETLVINQLADAILSSNSIIGEHRKSGSAHQLDLHLALKRRRNSIFENADQRLHARSRRKTRR